jgi:hypothetical protein
MSAAKNEGCAVRKAVSLARTLDDIMELISRYVVCTDAQLVAIALWIVHTHAIEAAEATPYLAVTSAEKQSGKSRLLEMASHLVARPWYAIQPSDAVVYRKIESVQPTLLLDETDAIFGGPRTKDRDGLRGILNAGNRRGATVPRCVGEGSNQQVQEFSVFCAKAFAGIGRLPETMADRSIRIRLKRRSKKEALQPYRTRVVRELAEPLRKKIERWANANTRKLVGAEPFVPDGLSDRAVEGWEPLFAVADLAGGEWPGRARRAALELAGAAPELETSDGLLLLEDIRRVFTTRGARSLTTQSLIKDLSDLPESPWRDYKGGLNGHLLGRLLGAFEVHSTALRTKAGTLRGYRLDQFEDAFARYLPSPRPRAKAKRNESNEQ